MTIQLVLVFPDPYLADTLVFFVALSTSAVVSYWLLAGLIAIDRPWTDRVRFRSWLASRHAHTLPMLIASTALLALMSYTDNATGASHVALTWMAMSIWMVSQDLPRIAPGRLPYRRVDLGLLLLRLAAIATTIFALLMAAGRVH